MPPNPENQSVSLPDELLAQFSRLEARLRKLDSALALCGAITAPALMLAVLWLSDRFWNTPSWLRLLLALAACLISIAYMARWARHWVWHKPGLRALATLVQRHHRRLGDRLLGVVELASGQRLPDGMSPSLCRAAIKQVSAEATRCDFQPAANPLAARRHLAALLVVVLPLTLVWIAVPQAGWNALQRLALPLAGIDRFTFVELELAQSPLIVPHGENFPVAVKVHYRAFWKPTAVKAIYAQQPEVRAVVADGNAQLAIAGQTQPANLTVRVGDAEAIVRVEPTHRPALKELRTTIKFPDYLQYPEQNETVRGGTFAVLEGGRASFRGEVNRPITAAQMAIDSQPPGTLPVSGASFETPVRDWAGASTVSFNWQDGNGLTNRAPWTLSLQSLKDQPPTISLPGMPRDQALLETDILSIKMDAQDDFGVREVGVHWMLAAVSDPSSTPSERAFTFQAKSPQTKFMEESYMLSPYLLRIPPDTLIEVRGMAVDHFPGREPVMTEPHHVFVIGLVRHAEMLRQQLEILFAQLEEVTRREESIAAKTREISDQPEQKLAGEESAKRAEEQAKQQERNAKDLEHLAQEGAKTMREAMRNPTFNEETIRDWARTLKGMQDVAKQEMQQAGQKLQSAQKENGSQQRSQELAKALESEQQAMDKLQKLQQQVNKGLDQLQAQTLAQRLRKLGGQETQLSGRLQELVAETIGLLPGQLSEHHRRANTNISGDQEKVRDEAKAVHDEMSRFFDRTQRENYGEVSKSMKEVNTEGELDRMHSLIASNITMQAMGDLADWSKRFEDWAKKLEPEKKDSNGGGSGQGGGTPQDDLMKQLMALLRMREGENKVREQTQLLNRDRQELPKYDESVRGLADTQKQLGEQLQQLQKDNGVKPLDQPLQEARQAMQNVEDILRRPNTGEVADKSQVKVLETLTDAINLINEQAQQQNQNSPSGSSAAQEMEFLMQMAQQQPGQGQPMLASMPGGNKNGGGTGQAGAGLTGDARGMGAESRTVTAGSGTTRPVPVEFREALELYYKSLERKE